MTAATAPVHPPTPTPTPTHPHPVAAPSLALRPPTVRVPAQRSGFVPMLLLALGIVGWLGFQSVQLLAERQQVANARAALDTQVQGAAKLRTALDALATATAKLAVDGNPNARAIVEQLHQRGITIKAQSALAKPP